MGGVSSMSCLSTSSVSPSSWSWALVVRVVCSCVVGSVVVVVVMEGRGSCCLLQSAAYKVAFSGVLFEAILCLGAPGRVAREVVVVSVGSGCRYALMSSSHHLAGLPCFRCHLVLVDLAGPQLVWCLAVILACLQ